MVLANVGISVSLHIVCSVEAALEDSHEHTAKLLETQDEDDDFVQSDLEFGLFVASLLRVEHDLCVSTCVGHKSNDPFCTLKIGPFKQELLHVKPICFR